MKYILLALITTFGLALGVVGCKSGGTSEGAASTPGTTTATTAHDHHDGDHHAAEGHHDHAGEDAPVAFDTAPAVGTMAKCPISGEVFKVEADTDRAEHDGKHYVFCCSNCSEKFNSDPAQFVSK